MQHLLAQIAAVDFAQLAQHLANFHNKALGILGLNIGG